MLFLVLVNTCHIFGFIAVNRCECASLLILLFLLHALFKPNTLVYKRRWNVFHMELWNVDAVFSVHLLNHLDANVPYTEAADSFLCVRICSSCLLNVNACLFVWLRFFADFLFSKYVRPLATQLILISLKSYEYTQFFLRSDDSFSLEHKLRNAITW